MCMASWLVWWCWAQPCLKKKKEPISFPPQSVWKGRGRKIHYLICFVKCFNGEYNSLGVYLQGTLIIRNKHQWVPWHSSCSLEYSKIASIMFMSSLKWCSCHKSTNAIYLRTVIPKTTQYFITNIYNPVYNKVIHHVNKWIGHTLNKYL